MRIYDDDTALIQHMRGYHDTLKMAAYAGQITRPKLGHANSRREDSTLSFWFGVFVGILVSLTVVYWML